LSILAIKTINEDDYESINNNRAIFGLLRASGSRLNKIFDLKEQRLEKRSKRLNGDL